MWNAPKDYDSDSLRRRSKETSWVRWERFSRVARKIAEATVWAVIDQSKAASQETRKSRKDVAQEVQGNHDTYFQDAINRVKWMPKD